MGTLQNMLYFSINFKSHNALYFRRERAISILITINIHKNILPQMEIVIYYERISNCIGNLVLLTSVVLM